MKGHMTRVGGMIFCIFCMFCYSSTSSHCRVHISSVLVVCWLLKEQLSVTEDNEAYYGL